MDQHEELFWNEILADPADDGPRRVYADWLVEQGDPQGDFIHAQCLLAQLTDWDARRDELERKVRELLVAHGVKWMRPLTLLGVLEIHFHRGFIDEVKITPACLTARLFEEAPLLRSLAVRLAGNDLSSLASCTLLDRIDSLILRNNHITNEHLDRFTFSPFIGGIRTLDLSVNEITGAGVHHLAAMRSLSTLLLENNQLGPSGARVIAEKPAFAGLQRLSLRGNRISHQGVAFLARSPDLIDLGQLDLSENALNSQAVVAFSGAHGLPALKQLDLRQNQLREEGAGQLAGSAWLRKLESLSLRYNGLGDRGIAVLARSPHLDRLRLLELGGNQLTDACCEYLAASRHLRSVEMLDLSDNRITEEGLFRLLDAEALAGLRCLDLRNNPIQGDVVERIAARGIVVRISEPG